MKYIYAGYIISLALLFIYGITLIIRRSKLERLSVSLEPSYEGHEPSHNHREMEQ